MSATLAALAILALSDQPALDRCAALGGQTRGVACVTPYRIILPGVGRQPSRRAIRELCRAFEPSDFRAGDVGVSAGGSILVYEHPAITCPTKARR